MFCSYCGKELKENKNCNCQTNNQQPAPLGNIKAKNKEAASVVTMAATKADTGESENKREPSLKSTTPPNSTGRSQGIENQETDEGQPNPKKNKLLIGIVAAVLCVLALIAFGNNSSKVDCRRLVQIELSGIDTKGKAIARCEWAGIRDDVLRKAPRTEETRLGALAIDYCAEVEVNPSSGLKNGDKVQVTVTYNEEVATSLKMKFKNTTFEYEVKDLPEGEVIDVFANLKVSFTGISPNGSVSVLGDTESAFAKAVQPLYEIEPSSENLSNGDVIIISCEEYEDLAAEEGYIIKEAKKEYTVEGLDEYVTSYSQLDEETLAACDKQAKDIITANKWKGGTFTRLFYEGQNSFTQNLYDDSGNITSMQIASSYLVSRKKDMSSYVEDYQNALILIYEVKKEDNILTNGVTFYYPIIYKDFVLSSEKEVSFNLGDAVAKNELMRKDEAEVYKESVEPLVGTYMVEKAEKAE